MAFGFFFMALGNYTQATVTALRSDFGTFVIPLMLTGVGAALLFVPLTTAVLGGVPQNVGAKASAYVNLGTQLGGSIAIAALSTLVDRRVAFHLSTLAANTVPSAPALSLLPGKPNPAELFGIVNGQATILAYADVSLAIAAAAFIAIFLVMLMPRPKKGAAPGGVVLYPPHQVGGGLTRHATTGGSGAARTRRIRRSRSSSRIWAVAAMPSVRRSCRPRSAR
jgi:hypothetical protein